MQFLHRIPCESFTIHHKQKIKECLDAQVSVSGRRTDHDLFLTLTANTNQHRKTDQSLLLIHSWLPMVNSSPYIEVKNTQLRLYDAIHSHTARREPFLKPWRGSKEQHHKDSQIFPARHKSLLFYTSINSAGVECLTKSSRNQDVEYLGYFWFFFSILIVKLSFRSRKFLSGNLKVVDYFRFSSKYSTCIVQQRWHSLD